MRYIIILLVIVLIFLGLRTCRKIENNVNHIFKKEFDVDFNFLGGIEGTGNVTEEKREVKDFRKLKAKRGVNVFLEKGNEPAVVVTIDENLQEYIIVKNEGDLLIIKSKERLKNYEKYEINVTYTELDELLSSSGSSVKTVNEINSPEFKVSSSSGASVKLDINSEDVKCHVSSGANAKLAGETEKLMVDVSSGANADLSNLKAEKCLVKASSGARMDIFVTKELNANASSGGSINYKGNPTTVEKKKSSGGSINKD